MATPTKHRHSLLAGGLTILALAIFAGPLTAQDALSNAERALLLRLGTRRMTNREFQRQLWGLNAMSHSTQFRRQDLVRQRNAGRLALENRQRLSGALGAGLRRPSVGDEPLMQSSSDIVLVWNVFGVSLQAADPRVVQAADAKYDRGGLVGAIRVDGPADRAGWQSGDILIGLYRYRIRQYADIAYVAKIPGLPNLAPIQALLIRDGQKITSRINMDRSSAGPASLEDARLAPAGRDTPAGQPAAARASSGTGAAREPELGTLVWQSLGVRGTPKAVDHYDPRYRTGLQITEIRSSSPAESAQWQIGDVLVGLDKYQATGLPAIGYVLYDPELAKINPVAFRVFRGRQLITGRVQLVPPPAEPPAPSGAPAPSSHAPHSKGT